MPRQSRGLNALSFIGRLNFGVGQGALPAHAGVEIADVEVAVAMLALKKCSASAIVPPRRSPITVPRGTDHLCRKTPGLRPEVLCHACISADHRNNDSISAGAPPMSNRGSL